MPEAQRDARKAPLGQACRNTLENAELLVTFGSDPIAEEGLAAERGIAQLRKVKKPGASAEKGQVPLRVSDEPNRFDR